VNKLTNINENKREQKETKKTYFRHSKTLCRTVNPVKGFKKLKLEVLHISKMLLTLGNPVLPLVYIITATSAERGKSASTGFSLPSLSTSVNEVIVQLYAIEEASDGISSSMQITRFTESSCPLMFTSVFNSFRPQITVVTSVWKRF